MSALQTVPPSTTWESKPATCLIVQIRRGVYVLPWYRFVWAEGSDTSVKIEFQSHIVAITGSNLLPILDRIASAQLSRLTLATANEAMFHATTGPGVPAIADIAVRLVEEEDD